MQERAEACSNVQGACRGVQRRAVACRERAEACVGVEGEVEVNLKLPTKVTLMSFAVCTPSGVSFFLKSERNRHEKLPTKVTLMSWPSFCCVYTVRPGSDFFLKKARGTYCGRNRKSYQQNLQKWHWCRLLCVHHQEWVFFKKNMRNLLWKKSAWKATNQSDIDVICCVHRLEWAFF